MLELKECADAADVVDEEDVVQISMYANAVLVQSLVVLPVRAVAVSLVQCICCPATITSRASKHVAFVVERAFTSSGSSRCLGTLCGSWEGWVLLHRL